MTDESVYYVDPRIFDSQYYPKYIKFCPIGQYWQQIDGAYAGVCKDHPESACCLAYNAYIGGFQSARAWGNFRLKTPLKLVDIMPGSNHRLRELSFDLMRTQHSWTWVTKNEGEIRVLGNDSDIVLNTGTLKETEQGDTTWKNQIFKTQIDLSSYETVNINVYHDLSVATGAATVHYANFTLGFDFIPFSAPEPSTVIIYVIDRQTGDAIKGASVVLLDADNIIAQGKTDSEGKVVFYNVPGGFDGISYKIEVQKSDIFSQYEDYSGSIDVKPGNNAIRIYLSKKISEIPWNWIVIGVGAVVGVGVLYAIFKGRPKRPSYPEYYPPPYYPPSQPIYLLQAPQR